MEKLLHDKNILTPSFKSNSSNVNVNANLMSYTGKYDGASKEKMLDLGLSFFLSFFNSFAFYQTGIPSIENLGNMRSSKRKKLSFLSLFFFFFN